MILEKTKVLKVSKSADTKEDLQNLSFAAEIIKKGRACRISDGNGLRTRRKRS